MKILSLHCDYIRFQAKKKAIKDAEVASDKETEVKEPLVILTAVEKSDEKNTDEISRKLSKEISDIAKQVNSKNIVLYPYAHLSSNLASPQKALEILKMTEKLLSKDFKVTRAPFGYYKSFELKCKGHPLSELSREINIEKEAEDESQAIKEEKSLKSYWYILDVNGKLIEIDKFNFKSYENLKKFSKYEKEKVRIDANEPAHIKLMKKLELVDYEPASDSGNLRYYPKGRFIKSLLERFVTRQVKEYGGLEVETPIMYSKTHPTLFKYLQKFPARQYIIESDKTNYFLRFSACFGQFLELHDAQISYKQLPIKIYELTRYSFRREQKGELTGLRRLRAFTMPDVHAICQDVEQAKDEFKKRFSLCLDTLNKIGLTDHDLELAIRITRDFYEENKEIVNYLVKTFNKPALIEMWDERKFYFILKYEFNFVDSVNKAAALSTDQIDVENGERYDINYIDRDGKGKHPIILHCSPSGAIERDIYALLEKSYIHKKPMLPLWLSPTQVRIIPVSQEKHLEFSKELLSYFRKNEIRTDIDDTSETVSRRIMNAEEEWIPYVLVVGDNEMKGKSLNVRVKETGKQKLYSRELLVNEIKDITKDMPYDTLPLQELLSQRIKFK